MKKKYEYLDKINFPLDLKKIPETKLQKVADELREEMIDAVSVTGGHLGASLGVVELTVALHYIFNTPNELLIVVTCGCSNDNPTNDCAARL